MHLSSSFVAQGKLTRKAAIGHNRSTVVRIYSAALCSTSTFASLSNYCYSSPPQHPVFIFQAVFAFPSLRQHSLASSAIYLSPFVGGDHTILIFCFQLVSRIVSFSPTIFLFYRFTLFRVLRCDSPYANNSFLGISICPCLLC